MQVLSLHLDQLCSLESGLRALCCAVCSLLSQFNDCSDLESSYSNGFAKVGSCAHSNDYCCSGPFRLSHRPLGLSSGCHLSSNHRCAKVDFMGDLSRNDASLFGC